MLLLLGMVMARAEQVSVLLCGRGTVMVADARAEEGVLRTAGVLQAQAQAQVSPPPPTCGVPVPCACAPCPCLIPCAPCPVPVPHPPCLCPTPCAPYPVPGPWASKDARLFPAGVE